jgi:two-component system response regulator BaeR
MTGSLGATENAVDKPLALIVEDEYDISVVFAKAVEMAGYKAEVVHAGDTAMTWLSAAVPDLVVLDMNLPNVMGADILKHIRAEPQLSGACVIVATAYQHLADCVHEQADYVLNKPVGFRQLINVVTIIKAQSTAH